MNISKNLFDILEAYRRGYCDAMYRGIQNNTFEGSQYIAYKQGYDFGMTEYCDKNHPEENAEAHNQEV